MFGSICIVPQSGYVVKNGSFITTDTYFFKGDPPMASFWTLGRSYRVVSEDSKVAFILHAIFYRMHKIFIPVIRLRFVSLIPCIRLLCGIKQVGLVVIQSNVPGLWGGTGPPRRPTLTHHRDWEGTSCPVCPPGREVKHSSG